MKHVPSWWRKGVGGRFPHPLNTYVPHTSLSSEAAFGKVVRSIACFWYSCIIAMNTGTLPSVAPVVPSVQFALVHVATGCDIQGFVQ